jgi:guanylate kinase
MKGMLIIVSAPSGAGKTTVVREVVSRMRHSYPIQQVITYTSRDIRKGEEPGVDYHWITAEAFEQKIEEGFFLEWSTAYGAYYGTPRSVLDDIEKGITSILIIDRVGARLVREKVPQAVTIWLTVSSLDVLRRRLEMRGRDSQEQIETRLKMAKMEFEEERKNPFYTYSIENSDKESTIIGLENMIVESIKSSI